MNWLVESLATFLRFIQRDESVLIYFLGAGFSLPAYIFFFFFFSSCTGHLFCVIGTLQDEFICSFWLRLISVVQWCPLFKAIPSKMSLFTLGGL
jgi:hypothetical protein